MHMHTVYLREWSLVVIKTLHQTYCARLSLSPQPSAIIPRWRLPSRSQRRFTTAPALFVPMTCLSTVGDCIFYVAAPWTWNSLPLDVMLLPMFKRHLQSVLFARSYLGTFSRALQFYFATARIFFLFLCDVLAVFWLYATIIGSFMMVLMTMLIY